MKHKIVVGQVNDVYVISDDGAVSRKLGIKPAVPWHLVADTVEHIGIRVAQMESLLDKVIGSTPTPDQKADERAQQILTESNGNGNGNGKLSLDRLGLKKQQLWRLKKAGVKNLADLAQMTQSDLENLPGIGPAIIKAVEKGCRANGIRLTQPVG